MVGRIAVGAWLLVIATGVALAVAVIIPSIPDLQRYLRIRAM